MQRGSWMTEVWKSGDEFAEGESKAACITASGSRLIESLCKSDLRSVVTWRGKLDLRNSVTTCIAYATSQIFLMFLGGH